MATFLDLTGVTYPNRFRDEDLVPLQGRSIMPLLAGTDKLSERLLYWEWAKGKAIRHGPWKLVSHSGNWELYNLDSDPFESRDLADSEAALFKALATLHNLWMENVYQ